MSAARRNFIQAGAASMSVLGLEFGYYQSPQTTVCLQIMKWRGEHNG